MKDQQRIPSQEVRTLINARNAVLQKQPTAFACLNSAEDPIHEEYIAAANRMRGELAFVHTFDPEIAAAYGVARNSIAVVMPETYKSKHEDSVRTMKQSDVTDDASIVSWLTVNSVPLLGERNKQNQEFLYTGRPLLVIYGEVDFSHQHIGATQHLREKLLPIALKYKDKLTVALSNEEAYSDEIDSLGLGDTGEDVNAAIFTSNQKFVMEPSEDYLEAIEEFINEWHAGELKPFLRSQPVPARQAGPVTVLVAASFEKMVIKSDKDYLIEFYAPWCGHCKKLEPVFKQLANQLSSSAPHVVVAKFDATSNDVPVNFDVAGFPTIYYVRATDRNNPVKFDGDRTVQGFKAFVLEQRQSDGGKEEL
uniref:Protein disulfide-isomerase A4 n=2 Tax=Hirondellea gigas TaxID=1518452 RepID=A0A6A7FUF1_9CRUS